MQTQLNAKLLHTLHALFYSLFWVIRWHLNFMCLSCCMCEYLSHEAKSMLRIMNFMATYFTFHKCEIRYQISET